MYMADKKVRGQKRLLKNMLKEIEEISRMILTDCEFGEYDS